VGGLILIDRNRGHAEQILVKCYSENERKEIESPINKPKLDSIAATTSSTERLRCVEYLGTTHALATEATVGPTLESYVG